LFELDPQSEAELEKIGDPNLRRAVERVLADPAGQREPRHNHTRRFLNPRRYVKIGSNERVWEFKTNHWRALFITVEHEGHRLLVFVPVKKRGFWSMSDCPWH
jgi:hypothetical protein